MRTAFTTPDIALTARPAGELDADLLVIPVFEDDDLADLPDLDAAASGEISQARSRGEFKGKLFDLFTTSIGNGWKSQRAALIGGGVRAEFSTEHLRRIATIGGLAARQRRLSRIALLHRPTPGVTAAEAAQVLAEGICLANYDGASYKTEDRDQVWIARADVRMPDGIGGFDGAGARGRILGEFSNSARVLANEPGNTLTPRVFADRALEIGRSAGLQVEVLDEQRIAGLN